MPYNFRFAHQGDIPFLIDTIIEAEKSGTDHCGLGNLLGLPESEIRIGLARILREEIEGCEFSTTEFALATMDDQPVAAFCGWIEGANEDQQPSTTLKSNLLMYGFGVDVIPSLQKHKSLLNQIQLTRTIGSHQIEYAYVLPLHRGNQLIDKLIEFLIDHAKLVNQELQLGEVQLYANNTPALRVYHRMGYRPFQKAVYSPEMNPQILPFHEKWMLQKTIR